MMRPMFESHVGPLYAITVVMVMDCVMELWFTRVSSEIGYITYNMKFVSCDQYSLSEKNLCLYVISNAVTLYTVSMKKGHLMPTLNKYLLPII